MTSDVMALRRHAQPIESLFVSLYAPFGLCVLFDLFRAGVMVAWRFSPVPPSGILLSSQ